MSDRASAAPGQRQWLTIAVGTGAVAVVAGLFLPAATGRALDVALRHHGRLSVAVANLALLIAVIALADVAGQLAGPAGSADTTAWLRRRMVDNLLGLGLAGQRRYPADETESRITAGAAATGRTRQLTLIAWMTGISTLGALIALGLIDWMLPVTVLVGLPAVRLFTYETTKSDGDYQAARRDIAGRLADALAGLRTIRASGTAPTEADRVLAPLNRLRDEGSRGRRTAWLLGPLLALVLLAVVAVAGWSLSEGRISPGDFVAAIGYAMIALGAMDRLDVFVELAAARTAAKRVAEVVADVPVVPRERPLPVSPGLVELRSVSVLDGERLVLDRCTLDVPAGSTLAVVGPPGAGKSTLVGLFGRLVEPTSGEVLIDGCSVSTMDRAQLRHAVGYAFARPVLVGSTVAEAIGYAASGPIEPAAAAAHADALIRRLPAGYRTRLADVELSDSGRQRIGLARAVAQRARVLVLDDVTSNVNATSEPDVLPGRTRIVVARRAETAAAADRVAWLDNGVIRAIGPHEVLLDEPEYGALWS